MNSLENLIENDNADESRQKRKTVKSIDYSRCTMGGAGLNQNNKYSDYIIRDVFIHMIEEVSNEIKKSDSGGASSSSDASASSSGDASASSSGSTSSSTDIDCCEPPRRNIKDNFVYITLVFYLNILF